MNDTADMKFTRFDDRGSQLLDGNVVVERKVDLVLNGRRLVGLTCLPGQEEYLATGFVLTEGIVLSREEFGGVNNGDDGTIHIKADIPEDRTLSLESHARLTTGCGRGVSIDNIDSLMECKKQFNMMLQVRADEIMAAAGKFARMSDLHKNVGGVHSAALFHNGDFICFADDISRHNAVDKVIGKAFLEGVNVAETVLFTTGRLTFELVSKAARMRLPVVVSLLSTTREAISLAGKFHITLCGRSRANRLDVYTCAWRIKDK